MLVKNTNILEVLLAVIKVPLPLEDIRHTLEEAVLEVVLLLQSYLLELGSDFLIVAFKTGLLLGEDVLGL